MKTCLTLPQSYAASEEVRIGGVHRRLNLLSFLCSAALIALGWYLRDFGAFTDTLEKGFGSYLLLATALLAGLFVYQLLHQLTHALLLRLISCAPVLYAWRRTQLFVGSGAYFSRAGVLTALLAPMLLWSAAAVLGSSFADGRCFWLLWLGLIVNLGGSMNDLYFALRVCGQPKNALYQYRGFAVHVFTEE